MGTYLYAILAAIGTIASIVFMLRARYHARRCDQLAAKVIGRVGAPRCPVYVMTRLGPGHGVNASGPIRCALHRGHTAPSRHLVDFDEMVALGYVQPPF